MRSSFILFFISTLALAAPPPQAWITIPDSLLAPMSPHPQSTLTPKNTRETLLLLKPEAVGQEMEGFGANLTESAVINFERLEEPAEELILERLFGVGEHSAGFSFLRVPIGSSDFGDPNLNSFTFNDTPGNIPDPELHYFNPSRAEPQLRFLERALRINPELKVMLTPWSPPAWMKNNLHLNGGKLDSRYRDAFASYLIKSVQVFATRGIPVDFISVQNEPGHATESYPSMGMEALEQREFIRDFLGPRLRASGLSTRILAMDHNWDMVDWADYVLQDPVAKSFIAGVAFHCYGGDISGLWRFSERHPDQGIYQTECTGWGEENFRNDLKWWLENHVLDAVNFGAKSGLGWNLILDEQGGPQNGGCHHCRGLVTIARESGNIHFHPEFWALAHASRFLKSGARQIHSETRAGAGDVKHVAFTNQNGSLLLVALNSSHAKQFIRVHAEKIPEANYELPPGSAISILFEP